MPRFLRHFATSTPTSAQLCSSSCATSGPTLPRPWKATHSPWAETAFILAQGLTVAGKPLKDHQEVVGHARAIDLLYSYLQQGCPLGAAELFALHKAVQTEVVVDYYKPVGAWKNEPDSTAGIVDRRQIIFEYAAPVHIPALMEKWFSLHRNWLKKIEAEPDNTAIALTAYVQLHASFVRIHPFADGNGRMARLIANLPVLRAGLPPIIIPGEQRKEYIDALSAWHLAAGQIKARYQEVFSFFLTCKIGENIIR